MEKSKKDYLEVFKKWCLDSSLDGLPSIARATSHILYLIFWITLFLGSVGLCAYMVAKSIIEYYQYDVVTTDRLIAYNSIPFPIVSFCNENKFLSPKANVYIQEYFYKNFGATNISSFKDIVNWFGSVDAASEEINWMVYELSDANLKDSVRQSLGYSAEDTFYKLEFNDEPMNLSTDLEWFFDPSHGNCFRFNSGSSRFNSSRMGYGLYAEIFTGLPYEYTNYIYEPNSKGIHVEVKDPDNFPYVYKSVLLQSGKISELILSKTKATILSEPYSKCENYETYSTPVFDEMKRLSIDYDLTICLLALYQYKIVMKTGCYNQQLAPMFSNSYPPCQNRSLYPDFNNVNLTDSDLIQMCPLDCQRAFYQYTLGFDSFPSESWLKTALHYRRDYFERIFGPRNKLDYKAVKSSFAAIYIDFENIAIEEINEKPSVELVNLFSNLGGTLGLFIGPSLLTILETFELVFGFFFVWLSHRTLRKSIVKEDSNNSFQLKAIS